MIFPDIKGSAGISPTLPLYSICMVCIYIVFCCSILIYISVASNLNFIKIISLNQILNVYSRII